MRILVTGAVGFVGYAMAALLIEHGHHVIGLTCSPTSALPAGVAGSWSRMPLPLCGERPATSGVRGL